MKKCPFCAEEIRDEAIKCRHCGEFLKKRNKAAGCLWGCFSALAVFILGCVIFIYFSSFMLEKAMCRMMATRANLWHFSMPFNNFGGTQEMFENLEKGSRIFRDFLSGDSSKDYREIYPY